MKYRDYVDQGLCPSCRKRPPASGHSRCTQCHEKNRGYWQKSYQRKKQERIEAGLCPKCGKHPPAQDRKLCETCLEKSLNYQNQRRKKSKAKGLCLSCGQRPPRKGRTTCEQCRDRMKEHYQETRGQDGICARCGKEIDVPGFASCSSCRQAQTEHVKHSYHKKKDAGLCVDCGISLEENPSPYSETLCPACLKKSRKRRRRSHSKTRYGGNLEKVIERDKGCVVCGREYGVRFNHVVCHHIDGDVSNNAMSNLVMLCRKCHTLVENWVCLSEPQRKVMLAFLNKHYPIK